MQLPVDIKSLVDEMTNIKKAQKMILSLSIYIDDSAPDDLIAYIRTIFASSLPNVRMTISYLNETFIPYPSDDLAVIVAGEKEELGLYAQALRDVGVPVMVVTTSPRRVDEITIASGYPVPDGDIISPEGSDEAVEPISLDEHKQESLNERIGAWMVYVCREKRLAFAISFQFMRKSLAKDAIQTTALQNAGVGLIPFIPGADLPIMTLNQAKMSLQIAAAYGHEMNMNRVKELALVVCGAYFSRSIARKIISAVPFLGVILKPGVAYGSTTAIGYALIEYFEGGENIKGVANILESAASSGTTVLSSIKDKTSPSQTSK